MITLIDLDFSPYLRVHQVDCIQNEVSGLYFFYSKKKELLYIGQATKLRSRLVQHINGNANTKDIFHNFIMLDIQLLMM